MTTLRIASLALPLLATPALAGPTQDTVLNVRSFGGEVFLERLELSGGALFDDRSVELQALTPFPIEVPRCVARVGDQVWLGTRDGLLRYGGTPLAFIDRVLPGVSLARAFPMLAGGGFVLSFERGGYDPDAAGATLGTVAYARFVQDIAPFQVGFMVATQDEILTTDRRLQPIGTFAPSLPDQLQNIGRLFHPGKFEILSDGRVIFTSQTFLAMTDPDGSLLSVIEAGQFEQDVFEGPSGFVIVATATGFSLVDPNSSRTFEVAAPVWLDGSSGEVSVPFEATTPGRSERVCSAGVNSTGVGATLHLLGTFDVDDASLVTLGFDMPRSTVVLPIFGTTAGDTPFGDGRLCVSPSSSTIVRGPVQTTTVRGDLRVDLDFMTPGFGAAFAPGTTWTFQWIYRDVLGPGGNGFNGTDAVSLTFQP